MLVLSVYDISLVDEGVAVPDVAAVATARGIVRPTGLPAGVSSGAAAWASRAVTAHPRRAGATVVAVFPGSSGERCPSTAR
ncbi:MULTISPECIES: hypothetical protein [unclassified Streptomyces]|uniref:hypothetical protein n=1 Tax=unclassified Streptomyces TaxID=2593676 RepID=UPI002880A926|nr:hypothetical protein [Streptomyces sp. I6]